MKGGFYNPPNPNAETTCEAFWRFNEGGVL